MQTTSLRDAQVEEDLNLVEIWLRKDPKRWVAGFLAGLFSGVVMIAFAMLMAKLGGLEIWFPVKFAALPFLGLDATGYSHTGAIFLGLGVLLLVAALLGVFYAHMAPTNSLSALLGVGFVWGAFSWIFIFCLYLQSWTAISAAQVTPAAALPVLLVYGFSLTSVAFFDRMVRGARV